MLTKLNDFSERLPPMLVKELRQSLRTRSFSAVFISLQLFLMLLILISTTSSSSNQAGETLSRIIFLQFSLAVAVLQPLRGINSVHQEIKSGTIDLMALTGLSSQRIILGKWFALMGQNVLMFVAIIPYLILRYFFGAMDLFAELRALSTVLLLSGMLCAIPIGLSANKAVLIRTIFPLILAGILAIATFSVCLSPGLNECLRFFALEEPQSWEILVLSIAISIHVLWSFLHFAIVNIAPLAENHSSGFRLWTLGFMMAVFLASRLLHFESGQINTLQVLVALPALLIGTAAPRYFLSRTAEPFVRWGWPGHMVGMLLYPCRSSALIFSSLIGGLLLLVFACGDAPALWPLPHAASDLSLRFSCLLGTFFFASVVQQGLGKKSANPLGLFIAILAAATILSIALLSITSAVNNRDALALFFWLPSIHLAQLNESSFWRDGSFHAWWGTVAYIVVTLIIGVIQSRNHRTTINAARQRRVINDSAPSASPTA